MSETEWQRGPWLVLACPYVKKLVKRKQGWQTEVQDFIADCAAKGLPAFASQYWFAKGNPDNNTVERNSAIIDKITFDIDGNGGHVAGADDAKGELINAMDWFESRGMSYRVYFSGSDGFAIECQFPEVRVKNAYDVVKKLYIRFNEKIDAHFDEAAMLGTQQKFRLPNSKHQKTGRYKVELTPTEVRTLDMDAIKSLAKTPRDLERVVDTSCNIVLNEVCKMYATQKVDKPKPSNYTGFLGKANLRPCTRAIMEQQSRDYGAMSVAAFELVYLGYDDEYIHEWVKRSIPDKYKHEVSQKQIDSIRSKMQAGDLFLHGCARIKEMGYCVNQGAMNVEQCQVVENEKIKADKLNNLQKFLQSNSLNNRK